MIDYDKEMDRLLKEARNLEDKSKLGLDTALFFDNEVTKLEEIIDDLNSTDEQIDNAMKNLEALFKRISHEQEHINDDIDHLHRIESGVTNLDKLKKRKK